MLCLMFFVAVLPLKNYSVFPPGDRSNLSFTFQIWDKFQTIENIFLSNSEPANCMDYEKETFERKPALMFLWAKSAADLNYVLSDVP